MANDASFKMYTETVLSMARYPNIGNNKIYPCMGLIGEIGEVAEHLKRVMSDDGGVLTPDRAQAIKIELGDVLWYIAALAQEIDRPMPVRFRTFEDSSTIFEISDTRGWWHEPMRAWLQATNAVGLVAKLVDDGRLDAPAVERLESLLFDIVRRISCLSRWAGFTLADVMHANVDKLLSRRARGVIQGSGDNR